MCRDLGPEAGIDLGWGREDPRPSCVLLGFVVTTLLLALAVGPKARAEGEAAGGVTRSVRGPAALDACFERLEGLIREEIRLGSFPGLALALVDRDRVLWAKGFGFADRDRGIPATTDTAWRVGSLSKLFTALGVMILVERGRLSLDAPIEGVVPDFRIDRGAWASAKPTTLRQILAHRSGFPRESPVGSYFDDSGPGLERTVRSLATVSLAIEPESAAKYSNAAVAVAGWIAARVAGKEFETFMETELLGPLGMRSSAFEASARVRGRLALGYMRLPDGRGIPAPLFELGTIPAGNLYSSVEDMARFLSFLLHEGEVDGKRILRPETLREMLRVRYGNAGGTGIASGFGVGFWVGDMGGRLWAGHSGAVYGFATQIAFFPEEGLGVIVCANQDIANAQVGAIARRALEWTLLARAGKALPEAPRLASPARADLERRVGAYRSERGWIEISLGERGLAADCMGQFLQLRPLDSRRFLACGDGFFEAPLDFEEGERASFAFAGGRYVPEAPTNAEPPAEWRAYLGNYGPDFIPTLVQWRHGRLFLLAENAFGCELEAWGPDTFHVPSNLYEKELLRFLRGPDGRVDRIRLGTLEFERRSP